MPELSRFFELLNRGAKVPIGDLTEAALIGIEPRPEQVSPQSSDDSEWTATKECERSVFVTEEQVKEYAPSLVWRR